MRYNHFAASLFNLRKDPPLSLIVTFVAGFLFFGLSVNYLYDFVNGTGHFNSSLVVLLIFLFSVAVVSYWAYSRNITLKQQVSDASAIPPMRWVITSVSPYQPPKDGKPDNFKLLDLVKHHAAQLEHIYLVGTFSEVPVFDDQGVEAAHNKLIASLEDVNVINQFPNLKKVTVNKLPVRSADSAEECFHIVDELLNQADKTIQAQDIVIDVTDGRKPMSIGLALAALKFNTRLSYLSAERDADGLPIRNGKQVYIELKTSVNVGKISSD